MARLHAMYVLDGLDVNKDGDRTLDDQSLRRELQDSDAKVRLHDVRLASIQPELWKSRRARDRDLRVGHVHLRRSCTRLVTQPETPRYCLGKR